jgi:hypothetical protein
MTLNDVFLVKTDGYPKKKKKEKKKVWHKQECD